MEHQVAALEASGHKVGVVAPSLLDFAATADALVRTSSPPGDVLELLERSTEDIRAALRATYVALDEEHVYHLGVRNWEANYLFPSRYSPAGRAIAAAFGSAPEEDPERELRRSPWARDLIVDGGQHQPRAVDSLPGGASAYTRDLITAIGLHDERFAPFGYEDADFCIRALQSGFTNWWMPSEILIHDIQRRSRPRRTADAAAAKARSRLLLAANHAHPDARLRVLLNQIVLAPFMMADLLRHTDETSDIASIGEAILAYFESYLNAMHSTTGDGSGARLLSNALIGALTVLDADDSPMQASRNRFSRLGCLPLCRTSEIRRFVGISPG